MFDSDVRAGAVAPAPSDVDDEELVELIRAWERIACWAAAGQLAAIAELARRRPRDLLARIGREPVTPDGGHPGLPEVSEFAVDEVAAALRLSRPAAGVRLHTAVELTRLPGTAAALRAGDLDLPKARAVVDAVAVLDHPTAAAVEIRVLPRAARQTVGQLRASLSRAVLAVDPAAAEARHERAVAGRGVAVRPLSDGMAELSAFLPADSAVAVYSRLDRLARGAPAADPRTMDARRADALVATVLTAATRGALSDALAAPPRSPAGPAVAADMGRETAAAGAARPVAESCGVAAGVVAGAGDVAAGVVGGAGDVPGAGVVAAGAAASAGVAAAAADVAAGAVAAGGSCRADRPEVVATVQVTVPAATALGLGEEPGELAGHGPVPASMARRLSRTGSWRKVTTDPATGVVVDVGRTAYTPSAALADLVRARDGTCRFPGCRQPARRCDLDHLIRWPDGPTEAANLAALCRHHHRLKHQTQWTVRAGPGAELIWTSPTGHRYVTAPSS